MHFTFIGERSSLPCNRAPKSNLIIDFLLVGTLEGDDIFYLSYYYFILSIGKITVDSCTACMFVWLDAEVYIPGAWEKLSQVRESDPL